MKPTKKEILSLIQTQVTDFCRRVRKGDPTKFAQDTLNPAAAEEQISLLRELSGLRNLEGKKLLEIGSGYGMFLVAAHQKYKIDAFGIEPGGDRYSSFDILQKVLRLHGLDPQIVASHSGESLPYPDNSFDIVYSHNTLEHVTDPRKVIFEALRVLKKGGIAQFVIPSYNSFWEGHYGILWLPGLPKWLAKIYVQLRGRDPSFINTLNFVTPAKLKKILDAWPEKLEILSWGEKIWEERLKTKTIPDRGALDRLKPIVKLIRRLQLTSLVTWLGKRMAWYTPIILTVKKVAGEEMRTDRGNFKGNLAFLEKVSLLNTTQQILEIGSGTGHLCAHLKNQNYNIVGTEINADYIYSAKEKFGVELLKIDGAELKFPDKSFDVVLSFDVFEHIPDVDTHLREVKRVLSKNGYYLLQTPNKWTNIPFETIKERSFSQYKKYHCSLHSYWELKQRFQKHGFEIEFVETSVANKYFRGKIKKYLGRLGLSLIKIINPDKLPIFLKTNFYIVAKLK